MRNFWQRWLVIARAIGNFQARVILTLMYFSVVAPFGMSVSAFADPLHLRRPSAWQARQASAADLSHLRQQF